MAEKQTKLALLPLSRIKTIMRSSPEVTNISQDSIFLVAKAAELFVKFLAKEALKVSENKSLVDYSDLAKVVNSEEYLEFLQDIIPCKIKASEYFEILRKVEEEENSVSADI